MFVIAKSKMKTTSMSSTIVIMPKNDSGTRSNGVRKYIMKTHMSSIIFAFSMVLIVNS